MQRLLFDCLPFLMLLVFGAKFYPQLYRFTSIQLEFLVNEIVKSHKNHMCCVKQVRFCLFLRQKNHINQSVSNSITQSVSEQVNCVGVCLCFLSDNNTNNNNKIVCIILTDFAKVYVFVWECVCGWQTYNITCCEFIYKCVWLWWWCRSVVW